MNGVLRFQVTYVFKKFWHVSEVFEFGHPWWVLLFWCSNGVLG
jgi:hypothetical protein